MEGLIFFSAVKVLVIGLACIGFSFSPIGRAVAHRITNGRGPAAPADDPRVDDLIEENQMLRRQMDEVHERLEFTERVLAQARERGAIGAPKT